MAGAPAVALVTGAGTGIGRAVSLALATEGFGVVLAGRRPEPLEQVATEIRARERAASGPDASGDTSAGMSDPLVVPTDVADPDSVAACFARTEEAYGRLDLLVNNAGRNAPAVPLEDLDLPSWRATVDVNLTGTFLCTQHAFRLMKVQRPAGGRIINNGSLSAHVPRPDSAAYTATKHAITGLTRSTALDGRAHGIACGQIDIGNATTPMTARMADGVRQADGSVRTEPTIDADHVARAVVTMAALPLEANVLTMTVMATGMPYVGRG